METNAKNATNIDQGSQTTGPIFGNDVFKWFDLIDKMVINCAISLFGIVTNIINIIVFISQGFSDPVNVSLLGVAIADISGLSCLLWLCIGTNPYLIQFEDLPYVPEEFIYTTAANFRVYFESVTCWITIFITIQRCLCVALPLKIKTVLTPSLTGLVLTGIFVYVFLFTNFGQLCTGAVTIGTRFIAHKNRSLLGVTVSNNWEHVLFINSTMISALQLGSYITIIASTIFLVVSLNRKTKWRDAAVNQNTNQSFTKRDRSVAKLVISLSTILIICYFPEIVGVALTYIFPEYSIGRKEENMYFLTWAIAILLEGTNSSVGIFVYYKMSSKYRRTFNQLFGIEQKKHDRKV